ncbi:PEP-CTERM sorting domain-containing protein [Rubrivivax albus]|uniref:PEP-CTERM sorting domain-containing protein n=1 Tax=Rubrivivax albus TaxID=2499835 RepID=UPI0013052032|nr:PEP-CTERM sorting domain-containing protein [Rubrivivax albus]
MPHHLQPNREEPSMSSSRRSSKSGAQVPVTAWRSVAMAAALCVSIPGAAADLSYLQGLLDATPEGGWVQVNTTAFSSAWASPAEGGLSPGSYSNPATVVTAWSSMAWDSQRGQLQLWGGGHANYMGNEMYLWQGTDGTWTRGSLPTRMTQYGSTSTFFTVDDASPQSAHTYDNNLYVPVNDMFVTFGGAAFNSGGSFVVRGPDGKPVPAGPWMWDPRKADANKVGGVDGSGYLPQTLGGNMWTNQRGNWVGSGPGPSQIETATAYRTENGKDVIYVTSDSNASGWQSLYRYELGDVRAGEAGRFNRVGVSWYAPAFQSTAAIDSHNGLFVQTSAVSPNWAGLSVWDLNALPSDGAGSVVDCTFTFDQQSDRCLFDRYITLVDATGAAFEINRQHGIAFDEASGKFFLWDGRDRGTVWATEAEFTTDGALDTIWTVVELQSTTATQPDGDFSVNGIESGVLGKWLYVAELGAFIALDQFDNTTRDAAVWLYKPMTAPVPEPASAALLLAGAGVLVAWRRHKAAALR